MKALNANKLQKQLKEIPIKNMAIASAGLVGVGIVLKKGLVAAGVFDKLYTFRPAGLGVGEIGIAAVNGALAASALGAFGAGAGAAQMALILGPGSAVLKEVSTFLANVLPESEAYGAAEDFGTDMFEYESQLEMVGFESEAPEVTLLGQ